MNTCRFLFNSFISRKLQSRPRFRTTTEMPAIDRPVSSLFHSQSTR